MGRAKANQAIPLARSLDKTIKGRGKGAPAASKIITQIPRGKQTGFANRVHWEKLPKLVSPKTRTARLAGRKFHAGKPMNEARRAFAGGHG